MEMAFYEPAGRNTFVSTPATAGPWSDQAQHGGPPSALAARAIERLAGGDGQRLARVTVDILRPVPVGKITVTTRVVRPGRRVSLLEVVLHVDDLEVMHVRGWRIASYDGPGTQAAESAIPPIPAAASAPVFLGGHMAGYMSAIDWRHASNAKAGSPQPGRVWARPRIPLLPEEEMSPMSRALLIADSGTGVSSVLDPRVFLFANVDLTTVLRRDPAGEWLLLDAVTTIGEHGSGLAESMLSDQQGPCGRAMQTLLIAPR
jgi:hypothetical protein